MVVEIFGLNKDGDLVTVEAPNMEIAEILMDAMSDAGYTGLETIEEF